MKFFRQRGENGWPSARAFTLIEIMLAIGIFTLVMAAIYSSWSAILRGSRLGIAAAAEVQRTRVAARALEESLGSAVMYADNAKYYSFFADTSGEFTYLSFVARLPESFPGSGLFPGQPLRRVTFTVDEQNNLLLSQSPLLEASQLVGEPYTIKLAPQISLFAVEFYEERKGEWYGSWTKTNELPQMVRIALNFGKKNEVTKTPVTMRTIPMSALAITRAGGTTQAGRPGRGVIPGADSLDDDMNWEPRLPSSFNLGEKEALPNEIFRGLD